MHNACGTHLRPYLVTFILIDLCYFRDLETRFNNICFATKSATYDVFDCDSPKSSPKSSLHDGLVVEGTVNALHGSV